MSKTVVALVEESGSTVLYLPAKVRDELALEQSVDVAIVVESADSKPVLRVTVDAARDAPGVRRTLSKGTNQQYSLSIPPALSTALSLLENDVLLETFDQGFDLRCRRSRS